jgi:hypothetical protein
VTGHALEAEGDVGGGVVEVPEIPDVYSGSLSAPEPLDPSVYCSTDRISSRPVETMVCGGYP